MSRGLSAFGTCACAAWGKDFAGKGRSPSLVEVKMPRADAVASSGTTDIFRCGAVLGRGVAKVDFGDGVMMSSLMVSGARGEFTGRKAAAITTGERG